MYNRCCLPIHIDSRLGKRPFCSFLWLCGAYCCALILLMMEKLKDKCRTLFGSRGCLGFCTKPVDEPSKGMKIQGQIVRKQSVSDDFWSTSTCEIDNSALQSHRSVSTLSTNPPLDPHNSVGSMSNPTEFVNHGLLLWNQTRLQWTGNKRPENQPQIREPKLSWNATYENLLGTNEPFPQPVPLSEMVDFLVDIWDQEGLYD